jgi:hypothetical protein
MASALASQTWSVKSAPTLSLESSHRLSIWVTSGKPINNLRIGAVLLQDATTHGVVDPFVVRLGSDSSCAAPANHAPNQSRGQALICFGDVRPGTYTGSLSVLGDSVEATSLALTIYSSNLLLKLGGTGLIVLGVAITWFLTVFLRRVSSRLDLQQPAAMMREDLESLRVRTSAAAATIGGGWQPQTVPGEITATEGKLAVTALERHGLPSILTNPLSPPSAVSTEYTTYLKTVGDRTSIIAAIVAGLERVAMSINPNATAQKKGAATQLDAYVADQTKTLQDALNFVEATLRAMVTPQGVAASPQAAGAGPELSSRQIVFRQTAISLTAWGVWGLITILVGVLAMVVTNPGFGTTLDLFKCLLWGLGVQIAGQQLQQLTPSSVSSSLTLTMPRAS